MTTEIKRETCSKQWRTCPKKLICWERKFPRFLAAATYQGNFLSSLKNKSGNIWLKKTISEAYLSTLTVMPNACVDAVWIQNTKHKSHAPHTTHTQTLVTYPVAQSQCIIFLGKPCVGHKSVESRAVFARQRLNLKVVAAYHKEKRSARIRLGVALRPQLEGLLWVCLQMKFLQQDMRYYTLPIRRTVTGVSTLIMSGLFEQGRCNSAAAL